MKRLISLAAACAVALIAAPALTACGTTPWPADPPTFSIPGVSQTADEKALIAVQRSYKVAAKSYLTAYKAGWRGEKQEAAGRALMNALDAISRAKAAKDLGDAAGFTAQLGFARSALAEVPPIPASP